MACTHCPFACTDASEEVQNYGCLPTPWDIVEMKRKSGHNWACHNNEKTICKGFVEHVEFYKNHEHERFSAPFKDMNTTEGGLISYEIWVHEGEEEALKRTNKNYIL